MKIYDILYRLDNVEGTKWHQTEARNDQEAVRNLMTYLGHRHFTVSRVYIATYTGVPRHG